MGFFTSYITSWVCWAFDDDGDDDDDDDDDDDECTLLGKLRFQVWVSVSVFAFALLLFGLRGVTNDNQFHVHTSGCVWDELGRIFCHSDYVKFEGVPPHKSVPQGLRQSRHLHREH